MKKILFFISIILFLFIINNFFHSIYNLWQKQDLITAAHSELAREQEEQRKLISQLKTIQDPSYVEEEARNKLFLAKPGEEIVVLPPTPATAANRPQKVSIVMPVWEQWYKLIF
jgi:cell division protein FtsB